MIKVVQPRGLASRYDDGIENMFIIHRIKTHAFVDGSFEYHNINFEITNQSNQHVFLSRHISWVSFFLPYLVKL